MSAGFYRRELSILFAFWACFLQFVTAWTSPASQLSFSSRVTRLSSTAYDDEFHIRDCTYAELGAAADIIVKSFYAHTISPWKQMYRMAELNRLQQGFPYADRDLHRMLVAVSAAENKIVGFCDIDARIPNRPTAYKYNPRPYLSDLCIHPDWRRKKIGRSLIEFCEDFCLEDLNRDEIFIRVEKKNIAAVQMYTGLGYDEIDCPNDLSEIVLLRKELVREVASLSPDNLYSL